MEQIGIRRPRPADEEPLESLITDHFDEGASYGVDLGLDDPTFHVRVADGGDGPVGVMAVAVRDDPAAVAEEMYFFDDPTVLPPADRYGLLEMGYVRDDATGRGVGSRLLERVERVGADEGVDRFVADSWFHGGDDSPEHLFDAHAYETVSRDPLDRPAAECPKCVAECTCAGALVTRRVE